MNKYQAFLEFFDSLLAESDKVMSNEVQEIYDMLNTQSLAIENKPLFTEIGLQILEYLQTNSSKNIKAKDIATGMSISSRQVSGAIRKLLTDGYVSKTGQNPVIYNLTTKGLQFNLKEYKEKMNNEEND